MKSTRRLAVWALPTLLCVSIFAVSPAWGDDWPQWRGPNRDGVWSETGVVEKFRRPQLKIRWRPTDRQRLQRTDRGRRPGLRHRSARRAQADRTRPLLRLARPASRSGRTATIARTTSRLHRRPAGQRHDRRRPRLFARARWGICSASTPPTARCCGARTCNERIQDPHADLGHRRLAAGRRRPGDRADRRRRRLPGRLRQAHRRGEVAGAGRQRLVFGPDHRSSRPAAACWSAGPATASSGLESRLGQGLLEASLQADQDGHQHRHAGGGERPAVLHQLLRRLADAQARARRAGRRAASGAAAAATSSTPTACTRSSARPTSKATTSTASTATASFAASTPRPATASGKACSRRPSRAGARSTWSATANASGCSTSAAS